MGFQPVRGSEATRPERGSRLRSGVPSLAPALIQLHRGQCTIPKTHPGAEIDCYSLYFPPGAPQFFAASSRTMTQSLASPFVGGVNLRALASLSKSPADLASPVRGS